MNGHDIDKKMVNLMHNPIQLKVMTYNIHHGKGYDGKTSLSRIAEQMIKSGAEIVALQEVDRFLPRSGFQDQPRLLARQLGMNACFSPSVNLGCMQYGNVLLSRFPIVSFHVQYMRGWVERRSLLIADLLIDGQIVSVVNTHLGVMADERRSQVPILLSAVNHLKQPAILTGDLNMRPEEEQQFLGKLDKRWNKITLFAKPHFPSLQGTADPIFSNMELATVSAHIEPSVASDHYPLIAEMSWKPG